MFFGIHVKSKQTKPVQFDETLKLGQAVLEPTKNGNKEPVSLFVEYKSEQFILCVLDPSHTWQASLDVMFAPGSEVRFFIRGSGRVHLTGYRLEDDLAEMEMSCSSDDTLNAEVARTPKSITPKRQPIPTKLNGSGTKSGEKKVTINDLELGSDSDDSNYPDLDDISSDDEELETDDIDIDEEDDDDDDPEEDDDDDGDDDGDDEEDEDGDMDEDFESDADDDAELTSDSDMLEN